MHTCPRRMNEFGPWERVEGLDEYTSRHGLIGQPRGCSFCGSMPPEDFLAAVKRGDLIGPTDKSYKLYVDTPNSEPRKLHVVTAIREGQESRLVGVTWMTRDQLNPEQLEEARSWGDSWSKFGLMANETINSKFYTAHLSPEQSQEFLNLWSSGKVNWGYPGYPYVKLYLPGLVVKDDQGS